MACAPPTYGCQSYEVEVANENLKLLEPALEVDFVLPLAGEESTADEVRLDYFYFTWRLNLIFSNKMKICACVCGTGGVRGQRDDGGRDTRE